VDDQNGVLRSYEHDAAGNIHAEVDALGARTVYSYDALGRAVAKVDALGRTSRTVRDRLGRITAIIAPDGSTTTRAYDGRGNVVREVDPAGRAIAMEYYGMGTISRLTTADGRTWRFTYTANERVRTIQNPKGESHEIVYDEAGRIVEERSFDGRKVGQTRNAAGRVERLVYPDGSHRTFEYDRCGRMIGDVGSDGAALTFQRDKRGRIVRAAAADRTGTMTTVFERDAFGRITSERQGERVISYAYDPWGRVTERRLPTGQVTKYSYSREHDLVAVEHAGHRFDLGHDAVGRATHVTSTEGGFSLQYVHDAVDRLVEERIASSRSSSLSKVLRQTTYDRAGRPTRIVEDGWGESRIKHDPEGRLAEVLRGAHRDVFRYDAANELVGRLEAAAALPQGWTTGPGGQLLKTPSRKYAYDKRGRRTGVRELAAPDGQEPITEYVWDARDRLRAASLPDGRRVEYTYDAFGRRLKKEVRDASGTLQRAVEYVWSGNALAAELRPEGARAFVNRPASLRPLLHEEGGEVFLYVTDHVGTPRELIDKTGAVAWRAVYDAWGQRIEEQHDPVRARANKTVSSPFRRLGQVHDDETGLAWTRFRVFDAATGRWLSPDPLGVWGGMSPTGFTANPLADIDPFGLAHTPDQSALNSMARDAERRPTRGQPPLTHDEAQTMIDWADETGMPVRASASDTGASGPSHWTPDGRTPTPHVHVAGHHVPVQPGFVPRGGFR
jgi:RHS repeat-associated protein